METFQKLLQEYKAQRVYHNVATRMFMFGDFATIYRKQTRRERRLSTLQSHEADLFIKWVIETHKNISYHDAKQLYMKYEDTMSKLQKMEKESIII